MLAPVIMVLAPRSMKGEYRRKSSSGEHYCAVGLPPSLGAGSDLASLAEGRAGWRRLYSQRLQVWTTHAHLADHIFLPGSHRERWQTAAGHHFRWWPWTAQGQRDAHPDHGRRPRGQPCFSSTTSGSPKRNRIGEETRLAVRRVPAGIERGRFQRNCVSSTNCKRLCGTAAKEEISPVLTADGDIARKLAPAWKST